MIYFWYSFFMFVFYRIVKLKVQGSSPGKCTLIIGKRGKGKSSRAVDIAINKYLKKGRAVYSSWTLPIHGGKLLEKDFYNYQFPPKSLLILDEGHIDFDSREFKNTSKRLREFLSMIRHYRLDVIVITQYSDGIEKLFRCAADEIWDLRRLIHLPGYKISIYKVYEDIIEYSKYLDGKDVKGRIRFKKYKNKVYDYYDSYIIDPTYIFADMHPETKFNVVRQAFSYRLKQFVKNERKLLIERHMFNAVARAIAKSHHACDSQS